MGVPTQEVAAVIARLASKRRGIVSREELLAAGVSRRQIGARLGSGALIALFPGVYAVAPLTALPAFALESAALVACRPRALLARASAAQLWELPVEAPEEIESSGGSTGYQSPRRRLRRSTLRAHPNRRGAGPLGALLRSEGAAKITRSEAERLALRLMRERGLDPESDVRIGRYRVDFLFRNERLIVEVDGYRFHRTRERFKGDRRRTASLMGMGFVVFPLTWWDLTDEPSESMARLVATLDERSSQLQLSD